MSSLPSSLHRSSMNDPHVELSSSSPSSTYQQSQTDHHDIHHPSQTTTTSRPRSFSQYSTQYLSPLQAVYGMTLLHSATISLTIASLTDLLVDVLSGGDVSSASLLATGLEALIAILQFFCNPLIGALSDSHHASFLSYFIPSRHSHQESVISRRRPWVLLSLIGVVIEMTLIALYPSLLSFILASILRGTTGATYMLGTCLVIDLSTVQHTTSSKNLGVLGACSGLGFMLGSISGVILGRTYGALATFYASTLISIINLIFVWITLHDTEEEIYNRQHSHHSSSHSHGQSEVDADSTESKDGHIQHSSDSGPSANPFVALSLLLSSPTLTYLASCFFISILSRGFSKIFLLYTKYKFGWDQVANGIFISSVGLSVIVSQGAMLPCFLSFFNETTILYFSLYLQLVAVLLFAWSYNSMTLYLSLVCTAPSALFLPILRAKISKQVVDKQQGMLAGAMSAVITSASFIGSILYGAIFTYFTPPEYAANTASAVSGNSASATPSTTTPPASPIIPVSFHSSKPLPEIPFYLAFVLQALSIPLLMKAQYYAKLSTTTPSASNNRSKSRSRNHSIDRTNYDERQSLLNIQEQASREEGTISEYSLA